MGAAMGAPLGAVGAAAGVYGAGAPMSDEATRILVIRHGQTAWNASGIVQGHTDIALDALGLWQAQQLARALADADLQAIYSSDLARARQTAAPLAACQGLELQLDVGLRERGFGAFEGLSFAQVEQRWPEQAAAWRRRDADAGAPGGEVLRDFRDRAVAAVTRLASAHRGRCIALVTHGGVLDQLYRQATRITLDAPRTWQVPNAGINRLLYSDQGLMLLAWGDVGHLEQVGRL